MSDDVSDEVSDGTGASGEPRAEHRCGLVAIIGRPNVGKSTLVNHLVGQKVAIVSNKPQTTRNRILAVVSRPGGQLVLLDTPGIHKPVHDMNRRMVDTAVRSLSAVDLVVWVVDVTERYGPGDRYVKGLLVKAKAPVVLALNKIDLVRKPQVLPVIQAFSGLYDFSDIVPISALRGENTDRLSDVLLSHLPASEAMYPEDFLTDQPERVLVAELVREQLLHRLREDLPYGVAVLVESFEEERGLVRIHATILVERDGQKAIVIGRGGQMLKVVGTEARREIEALLGSRVYLELFVKVRPKWREDGKILESLGLGRDRR